MGGDSTLSKVLIPQLKKRNIEVFRTTRRRIDTNDQILLNFDGKGLPSPIIDSLLKKVDFRITA